MEETQLKHLEFVQGVITRMNSNSFSIKTWMVTILAAFIALFANKPNEWYILAAVFPTFIFWLLDAYYLKMERQYRKLYKDVVDGKTKLFDMDASNYKIGYLGVLFSRTEWPVYLIMIVLLIGFWALTHFCDCI